jgi:hypothetical protein
MVVVVVKLKKYYSLREVVLFITEKSYQSVGAFSVLLLAIFKYREID